MQLRNKLYSPHKRQVLQSHQPRRQCAHDVEVGSETSHLAKPMELQPETLSIDTRRFRQPKVERVIIFGEVFWVERKGRCGAGTPEPCLVLFDCGCPSALKKGFLHTSARRLHITDTLTLGMTGINRDATHSRYRIYLPART